MFGQEMSESQRIEMEINISIPDRVGEDILILAPIMTGIATAAASVALVEVV
jgi:hypothetical protein